MRKKRKWTERENEERMRKWRENKEMEREISLSPFSHFLFILIFPFALYLLSIFSFSRHFLGSRFPASLNLWQPVRIHCYRPSNVLNFLTSTKHSDSQLKSISLWNANNLVSLDTGPVTGGCSQSCSRFRPRQSIYAVDRIYTAVVVHLNANN